MIKLSVMDYCMLSYYPANVVEVNPNEYGLKVLVQISNSTNFPRFFVLTLSI